MSRGANGRRAAPAALKSQPPTIHRATCSTVKPAVLMAALRRLPCQSAMICSWVGDYEAMFALAAHRHGSQFYDLAGQALGGLANGRGPTGHCRQRNGPAFGGAVRGQIGVFGGIDLEQGRGFPARLFAAQAQAQVARMGTDKAIERWHERSL